MIERRSNRRARNGRKTPKNVLFVFQNCTFRFADYTDNGIGIPEKSLPEIWNKFYRVPHGNRTDVRGYGIGLFYVKSIIDKHGWSIGVESKSGKGSKFTIKFSDQ